MTSLLATRKKMNILLKSNLYQVNKNPLFSKQVARYIAFFISELESGDRPFKVCFHHRDWMPGEFISRQIVNSVLDSRRTMVILSNNFMESVWGKLEFRTAHMQAINEGRARVREPKSAEIIQKIIMFFHR